METVIIDFRASLDCYQETGDSIYKGELEANYALYADKLPQVLRDRYLNL